MVTDTTRNRIVMASAMSANIKFDDPDLLKWREWNGSTWSTIESRYPPLRMVPALTYDSARKRIVLFGGILFFPGTTDTQQTFDDTWEYDPATQSWAEVNVVPAPTFRPTAAYDEARKVSVVLSSDSKETWLWDGGDWKKVEGLSKKPSARFEHAMTWHPQRQVIVLTGGSGVGSTWEWDGNAWNETIPGDFPGHLDAGHMATDHLTGSVIVAGADNCDTYRYVFSQDPTPKASWQKIQECNASEKYAASAADPYRKRILYQGTKKTAEWDGSAWQPTNPTGMPAVDTLFAMSFDKEANKAFLFLGRQNPSTFRNQVWSYEATLTGCNATDPCPEGLECSSGTCVPPGQGAGGSGGAGGAAGSAGQAGQAGSSGSSGQAGQGGAGQGGAGQAGAGQAGAGQGGEAGQGGGGGEARAGGNAGQAGQAGQGGVGGDAGSAGEAGASGEAGSGGDAGQGGEAGSAGQGGEAGAGGEAGQGGDAGGGGAAGDGGASGQGGANAGTSPGGSGGDAGSSGSAGASAGGDPGVLPSSSGIFGVSQPDGAGACGCRVAGEPERGEPGAWLAALGLLGLGRRGARRYGRR
jgi:hypothetical protein